MAGDGGKIILLFFLSFSSVILISGVVFVNGWTDAPNSIATAVGSGVMKLRSAVVIAAFCNFFGVLSVVFIGGRVSETVCRLVAYDGDAVSALWILCCAMLSVVAWSLAAWFFGIPTSESHALIAGLCGSAIGVRGTAETRPLILALVGLVLSTVLAVIVGILVYRIISKLKLGNKKCAALQKMSAGLSSFAHGAQDGQKFIGLFALWAALSQGNAADISLDIDGNISVLAVCICSVIMTAGTACGGGRIVQKVGFGMASLDAVDGACADIASFLCILFCTLLGMPVSTTHTKTCAIVGACRGRVNRRTVGEMVVAWVLTVPVCFACSFALSSLLCRYFN